MKIRIGKLEITLENMEELDALIERYGGEMVVGDSDQSNPQMPRHSSSGLDNRDRVVLQTLVNAGQGGVLAAELGKMLGKRGRGLRGAAQRWALRARIITDANVSPFEETRIGTQRALRFDGAHLAIAKGLL